MVVVVAETDENDEQTDPRHADEVRSLQERFARAWTHAVRGARHQRARSWASARRSSPSGVPAGADTDRMP